MYTSTRNVMPADCAIVLVQNSVGQFMGTKSKYPVFVYEIPKIRLRQVRANIKRYGVVHLTPLRSGSSADFMEGSTGAMLSPICDTSTLKKSENKQQEETTSDPSLERIRRDIDSFEQKSLKDSFSISTEYPEGEYNVMESSKDAELSTTIDPNNNSTELSQGNEGNVSPVNSAHNTDHQGKWTENEQQLPDGGPVNSEQLTDAETQDVYEEENYEATGPVNSEIITKNAVGGLNIGGTGAEHEGDTSTGIVNSANLANSGGLDDEEVPQEDVKSVVRIDTSKLNSYKLFSSEDENVGDTMPKNDHVSNVTGSTVVFTESGVSDPDRTFVEQDNTPDTTDDDKTVVASSGNSDSDKKNDDKDNTGCSSNPVDEDQTVDASSGNSNSEKKNDDKEYTGRSSNPVDDDQGNYE